MELFVKFLGAWTLGGTLRDASVYQFLQFGGNGEFRSTKVKWKPGKVNS